MPPTDERSDDDAPDASGVPHEPVPLVVTDELRRLTHHDPMIDPEFPPGQDMHDRDPDPEGER